MSSETPAPILPPIESFSPEQRQVIDAVNEGHNTCVIGPGGSGKSHLIRYLHLLLPTMKRKHAVVAYTGAVCAQVLFECSARTIHAWAGTQLAEIDAEALAKRVRKDRRAVIRWKTTDVLIIDEISMITADFLEKLNYVAQDLRENPAPFGGIQLVLCGDFLQLPPIAPRSATKPTNPAHQFCFESAIWSTIIHKTIQLKQVFRQTDTEFQAALAEIRMGSCSPETETLLKSRLLAVPKDAIIKPTVLYNKRTDVDEHNAESLAALKKPIRTFKSFIHSDASLTGEMLKKVNKRKEDFEKDSSHQAILELAEGAQVMLLTNKDIERGLVNGSRGVVVAFGEDGNPIVEFRNGLRIPVGLHAWQISTISVPKKDISGTAAPAPACLLEDDTDIIGMPSNHKRKGVYIKQIPLRLAYAITCHKSQGMTLDCVNVDLGNSIFEYGQAYVALSRVKSLDGLYIMAFDKRKIMANPRVLRFLSELERPIVLPAPSTSAAPAKKVLPLKTTQKKKDEIQSTIQFKKPE